MPSRLSVNQLFERMCAWDDENYIMAAGTKDGDDSEDTDGIVDGHAYTVLACENDVAGTEFDLIKAVLHAVLTFALMSFCRYGKCTGAKSMGSR